MAADFSEFSRLVQSVNLAEISLKSSSVDCKVPANVIAPSSTHLNFKRSSDYILSDSEELLVCFCTLELEGIEKDKEDVLFRMDATFTLIYTLSEKDFDDTVFKTFASNNAVYNAYPYLREIFQNYSMRIGIQPIKIPLLKPASAKQLKEDMEKKNA